MGPQVDLNSAIHSAECGAHIRDDITMATDWTIRYVVSEKCLYFFRPSGERAHKVRFTDAHRASYAWRTAIGKPEPEST